MERGILSGGILSGGYCSGGYCPDTIYLYISIYLTLFVCTTPGKRAYPTDYISHWR